MKKIKQYKEIIAIVIIILSGAFYWYELRPSLIKRRCANRSLIEAKESFNSVFYGDKDKKWRPVGNMKKQKTYDDYYEIDYNKYFNRCLKEKGL